MARRSADLWRRRGFPRSPAIIGSFPGADGSSGACGLSGRRAAFVFSTQPERNRQNEKTAHDDRRGGGSRNTKVAALVEEYKLVASQFKGNKKDAPAPEPEPEASAS